MDPFVGTQRRSSVILLLALIVASIACGYALSSRYAPMDRVEYDTYLKEQRERMDRIEQRLTDMLREWRREPRDGPGED